MSNNSSDDDVADIRKPHECFLQQMIEWKDANFHLG